jgi:DNA-binding MarR family transcriptional regulator
VNPSRDGNFGEEHATTEEARQLTMLIARVGSGLHRAREHELRPLGIPLMHYAVLYLLGIENGPLAPAEISRKLLRRHQGVLQLLGRMEKQGYVTVQRGPRKGGPVKVVMTDKGKEALDLAWEREQAVADIISSLSKQERGTLKVYLERLCDGAHGIASRPLYPGGRHRLP